MISDYLSLVYFAYYKQGVCSISVLSSQYKKMDNVRNGTAHLENAYIFNVCFIMKDNKTYGLWRYS